MINIKKTLASAIATGAVLLNIAAPALADTTLQITGNGSETTNTATVTTTQTTSVAQNNSADINNTVNVDANTGGNDAKDNTGGDVVIDTGDVDTEVTVSNVANSNTATVDCCDTGDTDVLISGNGTESTNDVVLTQSNEVAVFQTNDADIDNDIDVTGKTGDNDANDNTGGSVEVTTGDVNTTIAVSTVANANSATVGGSNNGGTSNVSAIISGNGSGSDNDIDLDLSRGTLLVQSNDADIDNDIDVYASTGYNDANDNTGGDVSITTGDVTTGVEVDNMVNFNWADVECDCLLGDLLAKISGNGTESTSDLTATLSDGLEVFQDNCGESQSGVTLLDSFWWNEDDCGVDNNVDLGGKTGYNDTEDNTGEVDAESDPSIETGDVDTTVDLDNTGNANVYGPSAGGLAGIDFGLNFTFDLSDLLGSILDIT